MIQSKQEISLKTKNQIQLIKQKYLKKNINNDSNIVKQHTPQIKAFGSHGVQKQKQESKILSSPSVRVFREQSVVNVEENKNQEKKEIEWSLQKFIQSSLENNQKDSKPKNQNIELQSFKFNEKDPFGLNYKLSFSFKPPTFQQNNDLEFQSLNSFVQADKKQGRPKKDIDLSQACKLWTQNPHKSLAYLYYSSSNLQQQQQSLELKSKNPNFPGIVQKLAEQFIFNNNHLLKDSQKEVVYSMALEYFSPSPKYLSDVLLVSLIKMSPNYASIYADQIITQMPYYIQRIITLKKYLLKQQLDNFVKILEQKLENMRIDGQEISIQCYIWLLIIRPNSNYCHQVLLTRNISQEKNLLAIFCILTPQGKQITLSILYLKCIDALIPLFIRTGILQKIISSLNQIKVPQALYQPLKFLKLKLIKAGDTKIERRRVEQDKSFINFLNEKVGKLKQVLDSKVNSKTKPQIHYNRVSGRYEQNQVFVTQKSLN